MYEIHKESLVSSNLNSKFFWFHSDRPSVHIVFQFAGLAEPEGTPLEDQLSLSQLGGAYYAPHHRRRKYGRCSTNSLQPVSYFGRIWELYVLDLKIKVFCRKENQLLFPMDKGLTVPK